MSVTASPVLDDDAAIRFPSLASLRAAHSELLKRHRDGGDTPELLAEVEDFIRRAQATGALLDDDGDRWTAQGRLDYWITVLYGAGREPPGATLAEFDPMLAPELADALRPYLGLDAFREGKHGLFFGRRRLIEEWIGRLKEDRLLAVVGSSGSGKSSLVLGGLLPSLKAGALPGSQDWRYYPPMVPGSSPLQNLARLIQPAGVNAADGPGSQLDGFRQDPGHLAGLIAASGNGPAVVVVDQFEEVFTLCNDEAERRTFVDNLLGLIGAPGARHTVVLTMRSDFESHVARLPATFQSLFEESVARVTPLNAGELREAIEKPAELVGLKFEAGIVDELIREILGEPAGLPLLQFTLLKLWESRARNRVTWEAYRRLGGARQALARSADEFYEELIPEDQVAAKRILLRLVRPGEGLEVTSNRLRRAELHRAGEARDRVDRVLENLIQARLVRLTKGETPADDQVEVAHEALVRNWPKLVGWLEEERITMRRRLRLTAAAGQWRASGREAGALLRGSLLEEALRYEDLNELEAEFTRASQAAVEEAAREQEAARQRELAQARTLAEMQARASRRLRRLAVLAVVQAISILVVAWALVRGQLVVGGLLMLTQLLLAVVVLVAAVLALKNARREAAAGRDVPRAGHPQVLALKNARGEAAVPSREGASILAPPPRHTRPLWLVAALTVASFGAYFIYWLFATWRDLKAEHPEASMSPVWHALAIPFVPVYGIFRLHTHMRVIRERARSSGASTSLTPLACALIWIVTTGIAWIGLAAFAALVAGAGIPPWLAWLSLAALAGEAALVVWAQSALNAAWRALSGGARACPVRPVQWAVIVAGGALWLLVLVGSTLVYPYAVLRQADAHALRGDAEQARTAFAQATQSASKGNDAFLNNAVCWYGSLDRFEETIFPACERAVGLAPGDGQFRDSRGLARALKGDYPGAIDDFTAFVEWSSATGQYEQHRQQREAWIAALEARRNPFEPAMLEALRSE